MKTYTFRKVAASLAILFLPLLISCSSLTGGGVSNDPAVAAQQQQVDYLKQELREAERLAEEARQQEKAAKNRLKAAEHELKAARERARRMDEY
ncbi:hypothetical protein [Pontibacter sp. H249]|uniref:hypothetical protein n=1 Tax=Pontibacter sp. H249 TaxID=3133420 RepID=UPI0030BEF761